MFYQPSGRYFHIIVIYVVMRYIGIKGKDIILVIRAENDRVLEEAAGAACFLWVRQLGVTHTYYLVAHLADCRVMPQMSA